MALSCDEVVASFRVLHSGCAMAVQISPRNVVGRDRLIEQVWKKLESKSLRFTAERRIGKTTVMKKMLAEPKPGTLYRIQRPASCCCWTSFLHAPEECHCTLSLHAASQAFFYAFVILLSSLPEPSCAELLARLLRFRLELPVILHSRIQIEILLHRCYHCRPVSEPASQFCSSLSLPVADVKTTSRAVFFGLRSRSGVSFRQGLALGVELWIDGHSWAVVQSVLGGPQRC